MEPNKAIEDVEGFNTPGEPKSEIEELEVGPNKVDAGREIALELFEVLNDERMGTSLGPDRLHDGCDWTRLEIFPPFRPTT